MSPLSLPARLFKPVLLALLGAMMIGCKTNVYLAKTPAEPMLDVEDPSGSVTRLPPPGSPAVVVGAAFDRNSGHLYLRHLPGTLMREVDRTTGAQIRAFNAQGLTQGCGGILPGPEFPTIECGLAIRWRDQHLFADHPTGNLIAEIESDGRFVRNIALQNPHGPIGGLEYDQSRDHLFILFLRTPMIAEVDLNGQELRRFNLSASVKPDSLALDSYRRLLFVPLASSSELGVFDYNGRLLRKHLTPNTILAGGAAARPRR